MTHAFIRLFAAASLAAAPLAHAAPAAPKPQPQPQALTQDERIEQGEKDGSLTAKEARRLRAEQDKIHDLERKAERHGGATRREQRKLDKLRDQADEDITKYKHNDRGAESRTH